jgi:hypothetical protein
MNANIVITAKPNIAVIANDTFLISKYNISPPGNQVFFIFSLRRFKTSEKHGFEPDNPRVPAVLSPVFPKNIQIY